ncbi:Alpha-amylase [Andreprevotia sp. IGB-42]|uniref:carbohydrate-binding domain-containing protein n=1 Tax=Andreprevotia sp. IGB-42 TaxID=2497473 RepID=UPI001359C5CE|nr:carbohydrate-binding domain-containing protein [Andreprevotia sp. IGB-42]KAF0814163.1 Alpha-amylase [Andreprevotia sp. IGB-42]
MNSFIYKLGCLLALSPILASHAAVSPTPPKVAAAAASFDTVTVRARATLVQNRGANMLLRVNHVAVGSAVEVRNSEYQDYTFKVGPIATGIRVDVVYNNDTSTTAEDRNLYIESVTINGVIYTPTSKGVVYDRGAGAKAWDGADVIAGQSNLLWNGALRFITAAVPTPVPTRAPTAVPTLAPTKVPTAVPTLAPTRTPTAVPTLAPTRTPTLVPTAIPTAAPTLAPTPIPTPLPTTLPGNPSLQGVSAARLEHKANVTVTGSSFGTRSVPVSRVLFDDASGNAVSDKWDYSCNSAADADYRMAYRAPAEIVRAYGATGGVPTPHQRIGKYISGAPYGDNLYNVCLGKNNQQDQKNTYISYYLRIDPSWSFRCKVTNATGSDCDKNFKEYDWAIGSGYFGERGHNYYAGILWAGTEDALVDWGFNNGEFRCTGDTCMQMTVNHDQTNLALYNYYPETGSYLPRIATPGPFVGWIKIEMQLRHEDQFGLERMWVNNVLVNDMSLDNRSSEATVARSETVIGGYHRDAGTEEFYKNNFRYYSQVYYDRSFARVVLANNANYSLATIVEPQVLKSWSDGQISFDVNLGTLPTGSPAYLFVFDENGNRSASGLQVDIGN